MYIKEFENNPKKILYVDYLKKYNTKPVAGQDIYVYTSTIFKKVKITLRDLDIPENDYERYYNGIYIIDNGLVSNNIVKFSEEKIACIGYVNWLADNMSKYILTNEKVDFAILYDEYKKQIINDNR